MYLLNGNKLTIDNSKVDFKATLFSGQVFRVVKICENAFDVITEDKACRVTILDSVSEIETSDINYFINYFNLDFDHFKIAQNCKNSVALRAINAASGLKMLNQSHFETLISFIISANNNIKRISKTAFLISETFGKPFGFMGKTYYSFPTAEMLATSTVEQLNLLGCGYRSKYILDTARAVAAGFDILLPEKLSSTEGNKYLCNLLGVGEKVADCVLLFAYKKYDVFPVDTWIERLYIEDFYNGEKNRKQIRSYFMELFGQYAGIIQQYLFYYKRENS